jgi:hypothetical protein
MPSLTKSRMRAMFSRRVDTGILAPRTLRPAGLHELGVGPDAGDHCLVPEAVIDEVALAAAFLAFPPD